MLYSVKTDLPIDIVKTKMDERVKEYMFGLLKDYNFQEMLEIKHFPIQREIHVFEICYPPAAQKAMESIPTMSVYLPCRVSAFEEDGKTVLTTIGMDEIMHNFELPSEFKEEMGKVYARLQDLMKSFVEENLL